MSNPILKQVTKRREFSLEEKNALLRDYDALPKMSQTAAARKLQVSQPFLNQLLKKRGQVGSALLFADPNRKRNRYGKAPAVEKALTIWLSTQEEQDAHVGGETLKSKAEQLARLMGKDSFKATNGWFTRWKKRANLASRKARGDQRETDDYTAADCCRIEEDISQAQIKIEVPSPPPDRLTPEQSDEWVAVDEKVETVFVCEPTDEDIDPGIGFDSLTVVKTETSDHESNDSVDDSPPVPSSRDVVTALDTIRRYIQHNAVEVEFLYKFERYVYDILASTKHQTIKTEIEINL